MAEKITLACKTNPPKPRQVFKDIPIGGMYIGFSGGIYLKVAEEHSYSFAVESLFAPDPSCSVVPLVGTLIYHEEV